MLVPQESVKYWSYCFYSGSLFGFTGNDTSMAVNLSKDTLKEYADNLHAERVRAESGHYYDELDSLSVAGKTVLEFGCGTGADSYYMLKCGAKVTACDIVPTNVMVARRLLEPEASVVLLQDYEDIKKLGKFDLIYSHGCIHHIYPEAASQVIASLSDALNDGGHCLVMVYTDIFYPHENAHPDHPEGPYTRGFSVSELANLFPLICKSVRFFNQSTFSWTLFQKQELPVDGDRNES